MPLEKWELKNAMYVMKNGCNLCETFQDSDVFTICFVCVWFRKQNYYFIASACSVPKFESVQDYKLLAQKLRQMSVINCFTLAGLKTIYCYVRECEFQSMKCYIFVTYILYLYEYLCEYGSQFFIVVVRDFSDRHIPNQITS